MKRAVTTATFMTAILLTTTFVWAGGMGGDMGNGGHMMDSYGGWKMRPGQHTGHYDQDRTRSRYEERQRAREAYGRDMRRLDREMSRKQDTLNDELNDMFFWIHEAILP